MLTSFLPKLTLWSKNGELAANGVGKACRWWKCPLASGGIHAWGLRSLPARLLWGFLPNGIHEAVSNNNIPFMLFSDNFICYFPNLLPPLIHGASNLGLWVPWARHESLAVSHTTGEARGSFTRFPFPPWKKKSQAKQVSLSSTLCYLRGEVMQATLNYSLTHSNFSKFIFFSLHQSAGTSPLETWTSTKALLSLCGWLPKSVFTRCCGPLPRGAGTGSQATAGSTAGIEFCQPITRDMGGQDSFWALCIWYWIPQLTQCHFIHE